MVDPEQIGQLSNNASAGEYKLRREFLFIYLFILVVFHFDHLLRHMHKEEMELLKCGPTSSSLWQFITDRYDRKLPHMLIIPFPVCAYAAINFENGRRLEK